jgi:hypothetical protein
MTKRRQSEIVRWCALREERRGAAVRGGVYLPLKIRLGRAWVENDVWSPLFSWGGVLLCGGSGVS